MRILVLYCDRHPERMYLSVWQHLHALEACRTKPRIIYWNMLYGVPPWRNYVSWHVDVIVFHTTLLCYRWSDHESFTRLKGNLCWVRDLDCVKVAIPQDEYDHSAILDEWLWELGVSVIFSNFGEAQRSLLYPLMGRKADFYKCLTGYIDQNMARAYESRLPAVETRPYHIVYRAKRLPNWFGKQGRLKHRIADVFAERACARGFICDISTRDEDMITGTQWWDFLASGRTVIGCESGSSVLDQRGTIRAQIKEVIQAHPELTYEEVSKRMPTGWDEHEFFAISPRHFEAVVTKTCQILVEGAYDDVLKPETHYIPLRRDLSNVDEVLERIQDHGYVREIAERAYRDICLSGAYSYQRFAEDLLGAITGVMVEKEKSWPLPAKVGCEILWWVGAGAARLLAGYQRLRWQAGSAFAKTRLALNVRGRLAGFRR